MSVVDREKLMERVGYSCELLLELVELFLDIGPGMFKDIKESVVKNSAESLQKSAHALKGSVGNFAAQDTFEACLRLETMGRNKDLTDVSEALIVLESSLNKLFDELYAIRNELSARR
ncbi:MAG: Hpt domain-containing protein [Desulfomonilaceae bacterium]